MSSASSAPLRDSKTDEGQGTRDGEQNSGTPASLRLKEHNFHRARLKFPVFLLRLESLTNGGEIPGGGEGRLGPAAGVGGPRWGVAVSSAPRTCGGRCLSSAEFGLRVHVC